MANHKSAKKRIKQNSKIREANRSIRSTCRTAIKKVKTAISEGDKSKAKELFASAEKIIATAATKGIYHKKNASRKISRLASVLNSAN
ncbi:UNVERIFIED_CONTAM: hypothetical protein GTU68_056340 [Idotea baltica]|nr:hypothetical protein [Idotea baltica]